MHAGILKCSPISQNARKTLKIGFWTDREQSSRVFRSILIKKMRKAMMMLGIKYAMKL